MTESYCRWFDMPFFISSKGVDFCRWHIAFNNHQQNKKDNTTNDHEARPIKHTNSMATFFNMVLVGDFIITSAGEMPC